MGRVRTPGADGERAPISISDCRNTSPFAKKESYLLKYFFPRIHKKLLTVANFGERN